MVFVEIFRYNDMYAEIIFSFYVAIVIQRIVFDCAKLDFHSWTRVSKQQSIWSDEKVESLKLNRNLAIFDLQMTSCCIQRNSLFFLLKWSVYSPYYLSKSINADVSLVCWRHSVTAQRREERKKTGCDRRKKLHSWQQAQYFRNYCDLCSAQPSNCLSIFSPKLMRCVAIQTELLI